ncbi:MAG TPA: hypothetical protein VHN20_05490 [Beijerinckiaceae bacterium]|nr:hypothetical protein [Beijerinckiaceae bacterium]
MIAAWPTRAEAFLGDFIRALTGLGDRSVRAPPRARYHPAPRRIRAAAVPGSHVGRANPPVTRRAARIARLRPQLPETVTAKDVKDPDRRPNPLIALLHDPTLRKGDIVMFPDGPRVFRGRPGARHAMSDFAAISRSDNVARATRNALAVMPVGENNAWLAAAAAGKQEVAGVPDVATTGSVSGKPRSAP